MKTLICSIVCLLAVVAQAEQNIIVIFDDSGSMQESMGSETKINAAKRGFKTVIQQLPADTNIGILLLNGGWLVPFGPLDKANVCGAINTAQANGGTPLGEKMKVGADALLANRSKHPCSIHRLLIITDGEATDQANVTNYSPDILARGISMDVIGVKMASAHYLSKVARTYRNVNDPASLQKAISDAMAETPISANASESDFDIIAAIPSEMASSALGMLTDTAAMNHPIGTPPPPKEKRAEVKAVDTGADQPRQQFPPDNQTAQKQPEKSGGGATVCWVLGVCGIIVLIVIISQFPFHRGY